MDRGHGRLSIEEFEKICEDLKSREVSSSFKKGKKIGNINGASNITYWNSSFNLPAISTHRNYELVISLFDT